MYKHITKVFAHWTWNAEHFTSKHNVHQLYIESRILFILICQTFSMLNFKLKQCAYNLSILSMPKKTPEKKEHTFFRTLSLCCAEFLKVLNVRKEWNIFTVASKQFLKSPESQYWITYNLTCLIVWFLFRV